MREFFLLNFTNFVYAPRVAAAVKTCREPRANDLLQFIKRRKRAANESTFALLCSRANRAMSSFHATAARTPGTLLAAIAMPVPDPQTSKP